MPQRQVTPPSRMTVGGAAESALAVKVVALADLQIHLQPARPPCPSILTIAAASRPEKACRIAVSTCVDFVNAQAHSTQRGSREEERDAHLQLVSAVCLAKGDQRAS